MENRPNLPMVYKSSTIENFLSYKIKLFTILKFKISYLKLMSSYIQNISKNVFCLIIFLYILIIIFIYLCLYEMCYIILLVTSNFYNVFADSGSSRSIIYI